MPANTLNEDGELRDLIKMKMREYPDAGTYVEDKNLDEIMQLISTHTASREKAVLDRVREKVENLPMSVGAQPAHIHVAKQRGKNPVYHGPIAQARLDGYMVCGRDVLSLIAQLSPRKEEDLHE